MKREKEEKRPACKNCGSKFVYIRIKDNSVVCRSCGYVEKREEKDG